ncbi:hypothetical protein F2Q69_00053168 [Brassica cretica]|uniref:Uncharacterized protein n=1 Tax=Brassica cretica TaxID=69181 RepID=A0A8S9MXI2_BRACR|nr:hypothetical protein F2Q69_00053168 [Brassica cretica]
MPMLTPITSFFLEFPGGCVKHGFSRSSKMPPQRFLFPKTETIVAVLNFPSTGTFPSKLLKDRLRYSNKLKFARYPGMLPERLLFEKLTSLIPTSPLISGMIPSKEFPCK